MKLSPSDVLQIRRKYLDPAVSQRALATEYNISRVHIGRIVKGLRRKDVEVFRKPLHGMPDSTLMFMDHGRQILRTRGPKWIGSTK